MEMLGFALKKEALLRSLTADVLKTSEIENEYLDVDQVRSSLARRVGIEIGAAAPADGDVEGIAGVHCNSIIASGSAQNLIQTPDLVLRFLKSLKS